MGGLIEQIEKLRVEYEKYNGWPKYLIINAAEAQVLSYEIAIEKGLDEEEAILKEYNKFRNIIICRVNDPSFREIVLK